MLHSSTPVISQNAFKASLALRDYWTVAQGMLRTHACSLKLHMCLHVTAF